MTSLVSEQFRSAVLPCLAGLATLFLCLAILRTRKRPSPVPDLLERRLVDPTGSSILKDARPRTQSSVREKRRSSRRSTRFVKVQLFHSESGELLGEAKIIDRSQTGVCISTQVAFRVGTYLQIRPLNLAQELSSIPLVVRNARHSGNCWEVGCEFLRPPPWNIAMHLG